MYEATRVALFVLARIDATLNAYKTGTVFPANVSCELVEMVREFFGV